MITGFAGGINRVLKVSGGEMGLHRGQETRLVRNIFVGVALVLAVSLFIASAVEETRNRGEVLEGNCPKGEVFFDLPRVADLDCCVFHANASCIKPGLAVCDDKVAYSNPFDIDNGRNQKCVDLYGLLSCSMFRYAVCDINDDLTVIQTRCW